MGDRVFKSSGRRPLLLPAFALAIGSVTLLGAGKAQTPTSKIEPLDSAELVALGRALFYDKTLSSPAGMACVSCHSPETGYTYPDSQVNFWSGTVPGIVSNRFGNRKPPSVAYAPYFSTGLPHYDKDAIAFVGGLFWDGRVPDAESQAIFPLLNPREMNNGEKGVAGLASKLENGPSAAAFRAVFGPEIFKRPAKEIVKAMSKAIVAFERSPEVSAFSSKYDAYLQGKADLSPQELLGMRLATGTISGKPNGLPFRKSAHCMDCHGIADDPYSGINLWTNSCYANLGLPRNPLSKFFAVGGRGKWVDPGMGQILYSQYPEAPNFLAELDLLAINGTFKAPTLRNVDKRPYPSFVKSYMHNGVFKSLKQVVHFYNSRNLTDQKEIIDFTKADPYANLKGKPLFGRPEFLDPWTLVNPTGMAGGVGTGVARNATPVLDLDAMQIGNLGLTDQQEDAIVAFLQCLTDGYVPDKK